MRSPGRTGVTTAVIALSLALAIAISSVALSFRESERSWFILTGDLVVSAIATEGGWLETPLSADFEEALRGIPGVARVETYRVPPGQEYQGTRITAVAVSPGFIDSELFRRQIVGGDPGEALKEVEGGALARQDCAGGAVEAGYLAAVGPGAFFGQRLEVHTRVEHREDRLYHRQTAEHAGSLLQNDGIGLRVGGYGGVGGDVAATYIFGEGEADYVGDGLVVAKLGTGLRIGIGQAKQPPGTGASYHAAR